MGIITGLKALNELKERTAESSRKRADFFRLKDGESMRVRFLQELDEESPHYDPDAGTAVIIPEHTGPGKEGWKRRAQCTIAEGACYPCERRAAGEYEDWRKARHVMYINVLENPGTDEEKVSVLGQSVFGNGIIQTLVEYASDDEMGGAITDREWKISRQGERTDTRHTATAYPAKEFDTPAGKYELFDLTEVVAHVPYENQERFYTSGLHLEEEDEEVKPKRESKDFLGW